MEITFFQINTKNSSNEANQFDRLLNNVYTMFTQFKVVTN